MRETSLTDAAIRDKIAALPPPPPRGWSELEGRLDLQDKLESLQPTAPAGSWSALERRMSDEEAVADTLLIRRLAEAEPAVASGWALLAARLELIGQRREMVGCVKVTEAALLLSALLLFFQLPHSVHPPALPTVSVPFPVEVPAAPAAGAAGIIAQADPGVGTESARVPTGLARAVAPVASLPPAALEVNPTLPRVRNGLIAAIPTPEQRAGFPVSTVRPVLRLPALPVAQPMRYVLNFFVSPVDVNQVVTLANPDLGIRDRSNLSTGYSFGTLLDIEQGGNALQTGLIYGYRSYVPAEILQLNNRVVPAPDQEDVGYGRLKYRTASIPLNYYRTVHSTEKWQVSGGLGISMNVILSAEFQLGEGVTKKDLVRELETFRQLARQEGLPKALGGVGATNRFINPAAGLIDGGGLLDNSSLYMGGSLRVERLISERWSVYFSPTFTRLFTVRDNDGGKGPLADRIHNTMLRAGARVRLTDK